jgi:hypothetical protein
MVLRSGLKELQKKKALPIYSSGDPKLDELLTGGFQKDLIYLLFGDQKMLASILQKTAVHPFGQQYFETRVAYVDE